MKRPPAAIELADVPGGPEPGTPLAAVDDIADGGSLVVTFRDGAKLFQMFLHRRGETVWAYHNRCPHAGTPLDLMPGRFLDATGRRFQCATHGARFRIEDGYCVAGPCKGDWLRRVSVRVADGVVQAA